MSASAGMLGTGAVPTTTALTTMSGVSHISSVGALLNRCIERLVQMHDSYLSGPFMSKNRGIQSRQGRFEHA